MWGFQLTHPWGCDSCILIIFCVVCISTHTPVRVWHIPKTAFIHTAGFQLTHPWGCDYILPLRDSHNSHFNSHTREGVTVFFLAIQRLSEISTHTPVRVWRNSLQTVHLWAAFQLTHPWGCDSVLCHCINDSLFQLTHPWGCDWALCDPCLDSNISTHTPVRVWPEAPSLHQPSNISTHTPVRVWPFWAFVIKPEINFNSHTREGVTFKVFFYFSIFWISTHTPVRVWQILPCQISIL